MPQKFATRFAAETESPSWLRVSNAERPFHGSVAWNIVKVAWNKRERRLFGVNARFLAWTTGPKFRPFSTVYMYLIFQRIFSLFERFPPPYHLDPALCFCWLRLSSFTKDVTKRWACRSISRLVFGPTNLQAFDFKLVELFVEQSFAKLSWEMTSLC